MSATTETQPVGAQALNAELLQVGLKELPANVVVFEIAGPMFFGAVENFRRALLEMRPPPATLIVRLDRVPFMDITGIQSLEEVIGKLRKRGVRVLLCEANERVYGKLKTAGVVDDSYHGTLREALGQVLAAKDLRPEAYPM
jgi:SulP family sulfate permease